MDAPKPELEQAELDLIRHVLKREAEALDRAATMVDGRVIDAVDLLHRCEGRVITTGMGKMGCVARKAAATFCSTGTPAYYLHPGEAVHGDLGIVGSTDTVLALSKSGETDELIQLLPFMRRFGVPIVAITGNGNSTLARHSDVVIPLNVESEADTIELAPTCSTTVALALCDALAVALMQRNGFTREQFAVFHPGGPLGKRLLLTVASVMHQDGLPLVGPATMLKDTIVAMSAGRLGVALIVDQDQTLLGLITDGDLRRIVQRSPNPFEVPVQEWMNREPTVCQPETLAVEAIRSMEERKITVLPVVDRGQRVVGAVHLHDLLRSGLA